MDNIILQDKILTKTLLMLVVMGKQKFQFK